MQLYLGALRPNQNKLHIRDIPKEADMVSFLWGDRSLDISNFHTGKGTRYLIVCPKCGGRCYEVIRYTPKNGDDIYCCKKCDPYEKNPYQKRTHLPDEEVTALIDYHIEKQRAKLEDLGIELSTFWGDICAVAATPGMSEPPVPFYPIHFDYKAHAWQRPKHMKTLPFMRMLIKLYILYELRNEAKQHQIPCTGEVIRVRTSKEEINKLLQA